MNQANQPAPQNSEDEFELVETPVTVFVFSYEQNASVPEKDHFREMLIQLGQKVIRKEKRDALLSIFINSGNCESKDEVLRLLNQVQEVCARHLNPLAFKASKTNSSKAFETVLERFPGLKGLLKEFSPGDTL